MKNLGDLPPDLAEAVQRETVGETIVWVQQSARKDVFRAHIGGLLIGIPWLCFVLLWLSLALDFFPLQTLGFDPVGSSALLTRSDMMLAGGFGSLFVLIGVAMVSTPYSWARQAQNSAIVVTDRHVRSISTEPMFRGGLSFGLSKVAIDKIKQIVVKPSSKRYGDVKLVTYSHTNSDGEVIETFMELRTVTDAPALTGLIQKLMLTSDYYES
jgi:hypothetical protein